MSRKVLVVDDAAFVRRLIRRILMSEGYLVHEAVSGRDAVEKFREIRPDLVTMDLNMPDMNGMDALTQIRARDPHANVIVVSAVQSMEAQSRAIAAGASEYVVKPFQPSRMVEAVRRALAPSGG